MNNNNNVNSSNQCGNVLLFVGFVCLVLVSTVNLVSAANHVEDCGIESCLW